MTEPRLKGRAAATRPCPDTTARAGDHARRLADAARPPGWNRYLAAGVGIPALIITPRLDAALSQAEATVVRHGPRVRNLRHM